jgi:phosphopantetheine adenylyltransferase
MTKIVKQASTLLNSTIKTKARTPIKTRVKVKTVRKVQRKTAEEKIATAVSKMSHDLESVKLNTADFLSLLASSLEKGVGVNYDTDKGTVGVLPRKPKELVNTIKYLKRQVNLLS